jgi:putative hydrolase of the HAD superfamily
MERIGITNHFDAIYDIGDADYVPKPAIESYRRLCTLHDVDPQRAAMVEDISRNLEPAAELGMTTVWVQTDTSWARDVTETDHIDHITDDLTEWLRGVTNTN